MGRLIDEGAVVALVECKIERLNRLLENPQCRGANRQTVASQISALLTVISHLKFIETAPPVREAGVVIHDLSSAPPEYGVYGSNPSCER